MGKIILNGTEYARSGGSGGHTIVDPTGTDMPQENKLQFTGNVSVSDDSANGQTVVNVEGGGNYYLNTIYSEEEKKVGYWTDGKPLYQRVFDLGSDVLIANNDFTNTSIDASQMQTLVDAWGIYSTGATKYSLMANISNNVIRLQTDRNNTYASIRYVVLQYTKSTDTADPNPQTGGVIYLPSIYSTEEREIGVWKDGKPLYQRTYSGLSVTSSTSFHSTGITTLGIETLVNAEECGSASDGRLISFNVDAYIATNGTLYSAEFSNGWTVKSITIQYTKTTDVAGSGSWTPSGANAVHYSTNEQVIGTWIDGKPLYEKTISIGAISTNTVKTIDVSNLNIDISVSMSGIAICSNGWRLPIPATHTSSFGYQCLCRFSDSNTLAVGIGNSVGISSGYLTIQYTKTTD